MKKTITKLSFIAIMLCVIMLTANCQKDEAIPASKTPLKSSNQFVGNYSTIDTVRYPDPISPNDFWVQSFNIVITQNLSDTNKINIFNLYNTSQTITANVFNDSIAIPLQPCGTNSKISGYGKIENNKLFYSYSYIN